jgi:Ca-activated chloride channel family protein
VGWLAAITCLVVALAQPRWGRALTPPLPPGHDVVFLVDASRSMGAEDAVPDRMGVAVEAAESLAEALGREPGDRAAVVAFAGRGVIRCPLTEHLRAVEEALRGLRPGCVRPGGTDLAAALDAALDAFDDQEHAEGRAIVVFSDGEDLAGTWPSVLDRLREAHVVVHAVAVGDAERGHVVPSGRGREPLRYEGRPVLSKRSDRPLEALARATGGAVVRLGLASADLGTLYATRIAPVARQKREAARVPEPVERYPVFVLAALAMGLGAGWPGWRRRGWGRVWLVLAALAAAGAAPAARSAAEAVAAGRAAFDAGRFGDALDAFEAAVQIDPQAGVARYDAAAALFRLGRFDEALARYGEARERADAALRTKIDYALGNTALALGDIPAAIRHYDDCLASTARGEALDAVRRDAAVNRRFAEDQAKRPSTPPPGDEKSSPPPDRPRARDAQGKGSDRGDPSAKSAPPPHGGGGSPDAPPLDRRRAGGAGGAGENTPRPGSPEERLDAALEQIREAKRRRLPEEPAATAGEVSKDW